MIKKSILLTLLLALGICVGIIGPQLVTSPPAQAGAVMGCLSYNRCYNSSTGEASIMVWITEGGGCKRTYKLYANKRSSTEYYLRTLERN